MSDMTVITEKDVIESVADALQYISYYHPMDYIRALGEAYEAEKGPAAKDAIAQILTNSRMCAEGHRPLCQDTGIVNVFVKWGQNCRLDSTQSLQEVVDEGVRRAYNGWLAATGHSHEAAAKLEVARRGILRLQVMCMACSSVPPPCMHAHVPPAEPCIPRLQNLALARAFSAWEARLREAYATLEVVRRVASRWRRLGASHAFTQWAATAAA